MKIRKCVSLTAGLAFLVMLVTSIVLYIVPQGRIAYWADWRLLGLSKEQWGNIHINIGILFLLSLILHISYNWTALLNALKNKAKNWSVFTREFTAALILTLVCILGTHFEIPPFSSILAISESLKDKAAMKYGEPPYGHAEPSSLQTLAKKMGLDLSRAGIKAEGSLTIKTIAENNQTSPMDLYEQIKEASLEQISKQWKQSKMWKKAGVSEKKMANLVLALNHETLQNLKDNAYVELLTEKLFETEA